MMHWCKSPIIKITITNIRHGLHMSNEWINILKLYEAEPPGPFTFKAYGQGSWVLHVLPVLLSRSRIGQKCRKMGTNMKKKQIPLAELLNNFLGNLKLVGKLFLWYKGTNATFIHIS